MQVAIEKDGKTGGVIAEGKHLGRNETKTFPINLTTTNNAPVANDDNYTTPKDSPLIIAVPGVLANDSDADGQPLTVSLQNNADHGQVTLNSNGSFTYVPDAGYVGRDNFSYRASDALESTAAMVSINITGTTLPSDRTTPEIVATLSSQPNAEGWHRSNVTVSWRVVDNESTISSTSGCETIVVDQDTTGKAITCAATNKAGLSSSETVTIKLDKTAPTITITKPTNGQYLLNESVIADYACNDNGSGLVAAACTGSTADGSALDTSSVGAKSFTVKAVDHAGNTSITTVEYNIVYNFKGFAQPVDNLPTINRVKAGQAIPVKFSLSGNHGLTILSTGYPASKKITCSTSEPVDAIDETVVAGSSTLKYDAATDQYTYVWKTDAAWAGTCRQLVVRLSDGTDHLASFSFTK